MAVLVMLSGSLRSAKKSNECIFGWLKEILIIGVMIDPRHLRVLREVSRTGSYSEAARRLGYTQPAISQQMRALERSVGTVLFTRAGRRMVLTEAGEALARHAAGILGGLAAAEEEVAAIAGLRAGRVRLVSFPSGTSTLVPPAIARVTERYPGLRVSFVEAEPPDSIDALRSGECDVALAFSYPEAADGETADLVRVPLLVDELLALLPAGHPGAADHETRLADLATERWIAGCPRCRGHLVHACGDAGFTPTITFATDDFVAVQGLVAAGLGVALVPRLVVAAFLHPGVVALPVLPAASREITALTMPELRGVPAVAVMLDALAQVAAELRAA
jgi:DNA-binding transcriptional LysR family regulator